MENIYDEIRELKEKIDDAKRYLLTICSNSASPFRAPNEQEPWFIPTTHKPSTTTWETITSSSNSLDDINYFLIISFVKHTVFLILKYIKAIYY